jgi:carbamoyl-phosphate synthase large subunit
LLPFDRSAGADALLGTGDALDRRGDGRRGRLPDRVRQGTGRAGSPLPAVGTVFLTVTDADKLAVAGIAAQLHDLGFALVATRGTAQAIARWGIPVQRLNKLGEGSPHVVDWIERGDVGLVINTPTGTDARADGYEIRAAAVARGIPCITTLSGGMAAARAIAAARVGSPPVHSLQELHARRAGIGA